MRKVVIGRSRECDVVLADTTDVVSRRQAVITFTFWGKMTLYDTSSNGTFVNGQRLSKPEAKVVTRKDTVNFGYVWDLDWSTVKDPYKKMKVALVCTIVALLIVIGALLALSTPRKTNKPEQKALPADTLATDSVRQSQDDIINTAPVAEPVRQKNKVKKQKSRPKKSKVKQRRSYVDDYAGYTGYADSAAVSEYETE